MSSISLDSFLVGKTSAIRAYDGHITDFGRRLKVASLEARLMNKRLTKGDAAKREMSRRTGRCKRSDPCKEPWCPRCLCIAQQNIVTHVGSGLQVILKDLQAEATKAGKKEPKAWTVSGVDERMVVARGKLNYSAIISKNRQLHRCLDKSKLCGAVAFLGLDVSLNVEKGKSSQWQPQIYGIVFSPTKKAIRRTLETLFPKPARKWAKPLKVTELPFEDIPAAAAYVLKPNAVRRERYVGKNGRLQTAKWNLKANEKDELAVFLKELGPNHRLLIRNAKIVGGRLVKSPPCPPQPMAGQPGLFDAPTKRKREA